MEDVKWLLRRCGLPILERLLLSWMEYDRITILISLFGIRLWSSHLQVEPSYTFLIL